jgi:hypothetical protein
LSNILDKDVKDDGAMIMTATEAQALLSETVKLLKRGQFTDELEMNVEKLCSWVKGAAVKDEIVYKTKAVVSEVNYYFGKIEAAIDAVDDSVEIFKSLSKSKVTNKTRKLVREQIRCYQAYVQATFYHQHSYEEAKIQIEKCLDFVQQNLVTNDFPSNGTQAQIYFQLGRIYRQLNFYPASAECFVESINFYLKRAELKKEEHQKIRDEKERDDLMRDELAFVRNRTGVLTGLGLGFLEYTQGRLSAAFQQIITAKILLANSDWLNNSYLNLLHGSILRCQAGNDQTMLKEAESLVKEALKVFAEKEHWYRIRAEYELALIHLALAPQHGECDHSNKYIRKAEREANNVECNSKELEDWRWVSNALVLKSRIQRKLWNYLQARNLADRALTLAGKYKQILPQIDSWQARAEANIYWVKSKLKDGHGNLVTIGNMANELREARKDLYSALVLNEKSVAAGKINSQNRKVEAVSYLYLALCSAIEGIYEEAVMFFKQWEQIKNIEHQFLTNLSRKVKGEIDKLERNFVINSEVDSLKYETHHDALRIYLIHLAEGRAKGLREQAKLLDVTPQTILNWKTVINKKKEDVGS